MKRLISVCIAIGFLVTGLFVVIRSSKQAHAQIACSIPKALGALKATSGGALVFEAPNGTISAVAMGDCQVQATFPRN